MIKAVAFDVGETLVDDTREWLRWAQWLGVRQHTLSALVGLVTAQGREARTTRIAAMVSHFEAPLAAGQEMWNATSSGKVSQFCSTTGL
jgi:hypothetical protein